MSAPFGTLGYGLIVPDGEPGRGRHGHAPLSTGDIVAIVFGVGVLLLVAAVLVYCFCCRKRTAARAGEPRRRATPALAGIHVDGRDGPEHPGAGSGAPGWSSYAGAVVTGRDAPEPVLSSGAFGGGDAWCRLCRAGAGYGVHGGEGAVALECGHSFHRRCIRRWMEHNMTCPACNATHIALLGDSSRRSVMGSGSQLQAPRLSVDDAARSDDLAEVRRSRSSRF